MLSALFVAQIETIIKGVDHASGQNSLWLVIAFAAAVGIALYLLSRFTAERIKAGEARSDRLVARLDSVTDANTKFLENTNERQLLIIAENTAATRELLAIVARVEKLWK